MNVIDRLFPEPNQSYFLFGPRGTGKSTLVKKRHGNALLINLLLPNLKRKYQTYPESFFDVVRAQTPGKTIIIDEIQKVPELLTVIHALIEEKGGWKFILTGSSARKLKTQGIDLLGGRVLNKTLHPFIASELKQKFSLPDALKYGLLPLCVDSQDREEMLSAYISLYLEEEVKAEGVVRNIEPFFRFLEALSFSHASTLNISNIARECSVKRSTVSNWLSIVEDLLISYTVPIFSHRSKRILTMHSKFYFIDSGIFNAIRPRSVIDSVTEMEGAALEGLIAQHLKAWIDYTKKKHKLYFWRTKSGLEVDFIVYGELGLWAIEVKNNQHIHPKDLKSLINFKQDYPEAQTILLYRGDDTIIKHNILCLPCDKFIKTIIPNEKLIDF